MFGMLVESGDGRTAGSSGCESGKSSSAFRRHKDANSMVATGIAYDCPSQLYLVSLDSCGVRTIFLCVPVPTTP
jgi:hypothetical protein